MPIIIICGLNGAGKSTLGKALSDELNLDFVDIEDLYYPEENKEMSEYIYSNPVSKNEVEQKLLRIISANNPFILASSAGNFNQSIISQFTCAIYLEVPVEVRLRRVIKRSYERFGQRILKGGDLHANEMNFFRYVNSKDEKTVDRWLDTLHCPILKVNGLLPISDSVTFIKEQLKSLNIY